MKLQLNRACRPLVTAAALLITATISLAQTWVEVGDAGDSVPGAQGTGAAAGLPLNGISGTIFQNGDADFFVLSITNFAAFSATTVGGTNLDTMLYLFDINGNPIYLNDDAAGGKSLQSTLPAGSPIGPQSNGTYILGISLTNVDPVNLSNQLLFAAPVFSTDLRGPSGALGPVTGVFDTNKGLEFGKYAISLTGAATALAVPEPSTIALLFTGGLGALIAVRRRFRS